MLCTYVLVILVYFCILQLKKRFLLRHERLRHKESSLMMLQPPIRSARAQPCTPVAQTTTTAADVFANFWMTDWQMLQSSFWSTSCSCHNQNKEIVMPRLNILSVQRWAPVQLDLPSTYKHINRWVSQWSLSQAIFGLFISSIEWWNHCIISSLFNSIAFIAVRPLKSNEFWLIHFNDCIVIISVACTTVWPGN